MRPPRIRIDIAADLSSHRGLVTGPDRRRAPRAAGADRRRERRAARRLDRDVGARAEWLREKVVPIGRRGGDRRGGQPVVHAPRRVGARAADRRPHRLGAERRLARRLPQRPRRRRGAAPDRRGRHAAADGPARQLGRRGRRALRPLAVRLSAAAGSMATRTSCASAATPTGSRCPTRSPSTASTSTARPRRARSWKARPPTSSSTSSRGRCSSRSDLPLGVVLGTFGVERHLVTFRGQAAHAGSTPMDQRRDALAGAAKLELELRGSRREWGMARSARSGGVVCRSRASSPPSSRPPSSSSTSGISTPTKLAELLEQRAGGAASGSRARRTSRSSGSGSGRSSRSRSTTRLLELADEAIREVSGTSHRLPSGPLHDAAEVARAGIPTVMLFVQSLRGLSHTKLEDTKEEHLELSVQALDRLTTKALEAFA